MITNKKYCVTFYVSLAEKSRIAISNLGVIFSSDSIKTFPPIPTFTPYPYLFTNPDFENPIIISDTLNWTKIQGFYTANGLEKHFGIGNFKDDNNTNYNIIKPLFNPNNDILPNASYYYIDNVSVVEFSPAKAAQQKTLTLCANTSYTLGTDSTWDATYQWQPTTWLSCTNCPNPVVTATSNIKYYLTKQQCSATTNDSVFIQIYTPALTANAGLTKVLCPNQQTTLGVNDSTQFANYNWLPNLFLNCNTCATPITNPNTTITYTLNKTECTINSTSTVQVILKDTCNTPELPLILPQLISANADGINDEIIIQLPNTKSATLKVFNRWGNEVYNIENVASTSSATIYLKWSGTYKNQPLPAGTYFYIVESVTTSGELKNYRQFVVLVR
jgi:gliding motility-associated-like protein